MPLRTRKASFVRWATRGTASPASTKWRALAESSQQNPCNPCHPQLSFWFLSLALKVRFIFNPFSGSNRKSPYLRDRAAEFIAQHGLDGTIVSTERPRHATELAQQAVAEGCNLVVAIGGDGTMNEVATGLVDSPARFGPLPRPL